MKNRPLLLVEWDDITTDSCWMPENGDYTTKSVHCYSVGWQLKSNKRCLVITPMRAQDGICGDRQVIPRGTITSIRRLSDAVES